jgi:hypothetical protein
MPITKLRLNEEHRNVSRAAPGSPANVARMRFVLEFWSRVRARHVVHGVSKYRSIEEAQDAALSRR